MCFTRKWADRQYSSTADAIKCDLLPTVELLGPMSQLIQGDSSRTPYCKNSNQPIPLEQTSQLLMWSSMYAGLYLATSLSIGRDQLATLSCSALFSYTNSYNLLAAVPWNVPSLITYKKTYKEIAQVDVQVDIQSISLLTLSYGAIL